MNVNEYGIYFLFSTGFDMRDFTGLEIHFTKPDGSALVVTNPDVSVGTTNVTTTIGPFTAYKYAQYVFKDGDVDQTGTWSARVVYDDSTQHLISDVATFTINP